MKTKINFHFLFVLVAACLWGAAGLFVRSLNGQNIFDMQIVLGRAVFSAATLGAVILITDIRLFKIRLKDLWLFLSGGIFSIVLFNYSYYKTMALTSLSVAAVLLYTAPFFVVIISVFLFREKLSFNKVFACIIAFSGCCFVSGLFDETHRISSKALFFGLLTGFGYALYTVFSELLIKRGYKTLTITFYVFLSAAVMSLVFVPIGETVKAYTQNISALITVFLMALFNTVIPYLLYTSGLRSVEPSVAPIIATVEPVVATLIGALYFKEDITLLGKIGIVLVVISVMVLNLKSNKVKLRANAKINLVLDITGKRDDGYHLIDTVMQSVSLFDRVAVSKAKKITVRCGSLSGEENIAFKAASLFLAETNINGGARIKIKKNIPAAAGLGGGSVDAAAVLLALNKIYETNLTNNRLCDMALQLGADVPFFIEGGTKRAQGIGEVLTSVSALEKGYFILVKQSDKLSTGQMYKELDSNDYPHPNVQQLISAISGQDLEEIAKGMDNCFACVNKPFGLKERLLSEGALAVSLSGSGPTYFAFFEDKSKAENVYKALNKEKMECYLTTPEKNGIEFE